MPDLHARLKGRRPSLLLFGLLAVLVLSSGLGLRDPWPADEPRFALVAREMVETGQWLIPMRGGEAYADKPPLFMWAIAVGYQFTGSMRLAFLLPSLLAALGTLLLTYDLGKRMWNRRVGLLAAACLLGILQFTLQGKTAQIDALLCFWTTLGLYGLLRHLLIGPAWGWYTAGGIAMGFGVITKGVGFLSALVFIPYALAAWRGVPRPALQGSRWLWVAAPLALVAAVAVWGLPMLLKVASSEAPEFEAYRQNLLVHQTLGRYAHAWHHEQPPWYYLIQAPVLWLPVSALLPWLIPAWWRRLHRKDLRHMLLLGWIAAVLIFFSLSSGKRGVYLLPITPALALAVAPLLPGLMRKLAVQRTALALLGIGAVGLLGLCALLLFPQADFGLRLLGQALEPGGRLWLALGSGLVGGLGVLLLWTRKLAGAVPAVFVWLCGLWVVLGWLGYPALNPVRSTAPFMAEVARRIGPAAELAIVDWKEQYLLFADRPVQHFGYHTDEPLQARQGARWLAAKPGRYLLVTSKLLAQACLRPEAVADLGVRHRTHWYLAERSALDLDCVAALPADASSSAHQKAAEIAQ